MTGDMSAVNIIPSIVTVEKTLVMNIVYGWKACGKNTHYLLSCDLPPMIGHAVGFSQNII